MAGHSSEEMKGTETNEVNFADMKLTELPSLGGISTQHITTVNMENNLLSTIPPEIFNLTSLEHLNMAHNNMTSVPNDVGKLKQLKSLNLKGNNLNELPDDLKHLSLLRHFSLSKNQLSEVPVVLGKLRRLNSLDLSFNSLSLLPPAVNCLECLTVLDISHNYIEEINSRPRWVSTIIELSLDHNRIQQLPLWLNEASKLQRLSLSNNPLSFKFHRTETDRILPSRIPNLPNVNYLNIENCGIGPLIPPGLEKMTKLVELKLGNAFVPATYSNLMADAMLDNFLLDLPPKLFDAIGANLQVLDLRNVHLANLPSNLSPLKSLRVLLLCGNPLMWLPPSFHSLQSLEICDVSNCQLIALPSLIGKLPLITLKAPRNKLQVLPDSLKTLSQLQHLDLYDNQLESVPQYIIDLPSLKEFDAEYNCCKMEDQLSETTVLVYHKMKSNLRRLHGALKRQDGPKDKSPSASPLQEDSEDASDTSSDQQAPEIEDVPWDASTDFDTGLNINKGSDDWSSVTDGSDLGDNFDPFSIPAVTRSTIPSWELANWHLKDSEHYFCPADAHAPSVSRVRFPVSVESGQFDDAD